MAMLPTIVEISLVQSNYNKTTNENTKTGQKQMQALFHWRNRWIVGLKFFLTQIKGNLKYPKRSNRT